ncbi:hypothetical protein PMZ80_006385 [Knufia obscura]|uniref:Uncharacterized protein n=2 Tax=Knufia TaxID=430999 RepID=A0AAN8EKF7_9EURO|nr:hypothetical protein PMZ80_006385 [Knufia obscura]KAK5953468.1 hypothetical protein OHC33_005412 [Knufia fluminis]
MPPEQWRRDGFSQDWYIWRKESSGPLEEDQIVTPFRSTSVVWCQQSQKYWFVPRDCTETTQRSAENDPEVWDNWHPLFFYDLGSETQRPRPGLWKILPTGLKRQHDGGCPRNFDEFLPKHFFFFGGDTQDTRCHFIGDLSLMLALLAMCPRKPDKILEQISQKFYANNSSRFESSEDPIDRSVKPGRALVMQVAIVTNADDSRAEIQRRRNQLESWERGELGSMVSSHTPSPAEKQAWGV